MRKQYLGTYRAFLVSILSFSLVISFGLHTIQVEHSHPGEHTHHEGHGFPVDIDEYFHGIEQKFFLAILSLILLSAWTVCFLIQSLWTPVYLAPQRQRSDWHRSVSPFVHYLIELFRTGILHPKVF